MDLLALVSEGLTYKEAAVRLGRSPSEVLMEIDQLLEALGSSTHLLAVQVPYSDSAITLQLAALDQHLMRVRRELKVAELSIRLMEMVSNGYLRSGALGGLVTLVDEMLGALRAQMARPGFPGSMDSPLLTSWKNSLELARSVFVEWTRTTWSRWQAEIAGLTDLEGAQQWRGSGVSIMIKSRLESGVLAIREILAAVDNAESADIAVHSSEPSTERIADDGIDEMLNNVYNFIPRMSHEVPSPMPSTPEALAPETLDAGSTVGGVLARLSDASAELERRSQEVDELAVSARALGASWIKIGNAVGLSSQAAYRRWDPSGKERQRLYQREVRSRPEMRRSE